MTVLGVFRGSLFRMSIKNFTPRLCESYNPMLRCRPVHKLISTSLIIVNKSHSGSPLPPSTVSKRLSNEEWEQKLSPEQFNICRCGGTEPPFSGKYYNHSGVGTYCCSCCSAALFSSETKYDSGSGWPSFYASLDDSIAEKLDNSHGMKRVEVTCSKCNSHLGHVFNDGPEPTGKRYCINSISLQFEPSSDS